MQTTRVAADFILANARLTNRLICKHPLLTHAPPVPGESRKTESWLGQTRDEWKCRRKTRTGRVRERLRGNGWWSWLMLWRGIKSTLWIIHRNVPDGNNGRGTLHLPYRTLIKQNVTLKYYYFYSKCFVLHHERKCFSSFLLEIPAQRERIMTFF